MKCPPLHVLAVPLLVLPLACQAPPAEPGAARAEPAAGGDVGGLPTIAEHTHGLRSTEGFVGLWWDAEQARLLVRLPAEGREFLHYVALRAGLGSNDVGLDRGQLGARWLCVVRRVGRRAFLVVPNLDWRSADPRAPQGRALREAFAEGVLWGFDVVAEEDGRVLVDATDFFLRDAHGIAGKLEASGQGRFRLEASRSSYAPERFAGFPENSLVEVVQTFVSDGPGPEVRRAAAEPASVSFRLRHAFVALPDLAQHPYRPRTYHPRSGFWDVGWTQVDAPLGTPTARRLVPRHHLTAEEPIVYYVDRAAPPDVHRALLEGARYWQPVFAAAGFPGGFRVASMPEGLDPLDVRHNVIQWVERSTRGWSYGDAIVDPRTGEILKGHVTLGALRVRQDVLLFQGLLNDADDPRVVEAALARIRQLAAHEVGHTLGLTHNFAASMDGRESVMDYPAPRVRVGADGALDLSDAYRDGCGAWDELAIRYGYAAFEDEAEGLAATLEEMDGRGLSYVADGDARGPGRAHPRGNLWDEGADALEALRTAYRVRHLALDRLSEEALPEGEPLAALEGVFVPVYLHHRYQLEAAVRLIGGRTFGYPEGDEDGGRVAVVDAARQREALAVVMESLQPEFLRYPARLAARFPPPPPGHARSRESFAPGEREHDPLDPLRASVEHTLELLLHRERLARVARQAEREPDELSLDELLQSLAAVFLGSSGGGADAAATDEAARFETRTLLLNHLIAAAEDPRGDAAVRATLWRMLDGLRAEGTILGPWHAELLRRTLEAPHEPHAPLDDPRVPPGSPIGSERGCSRG